MADDRIQPQPLEGVNVDKENEEHAAEPAESKQSHALVYHNHSEYGKRKEGKL